MGLAAVAGRGDNLQLAQARHTSPGVATRKASSTAIDAADNVHVLQDRRRLHRGPAGRGGQHILDHRALRPQHSRFGGGFGEAGGPEPEGAAAESAGVLAGGLGGA